MPQSLDVRFLCSCCFAASSPKNKAWPWPAKIFSFFSAQPIAELPLGYWCSALFVQSLSSAKETSVGKRVAFFKELASVYALLHVCHV